ncbi:hypothetical protein G6F56_004987 [Rhizopus delemar]|uniref:HCP-like protein n=1 Tax=Rhizopus stolonifer TaxID=4846 RepID=A0A367KMD2_RHIST|nr:hypothetical protein G6F56_004987 [Rhizopus delemar]RCI03394.1 hypothetical protein CU098_002616 [Rhizopus stolonifer]
MVNVVPSPTIGVRTQSSDESVSEDSIAESSRTVLTHMETIDENENVLTELGSQPNLIPPVATARRYQQWPVPENIEQMHALCEQEKVKGDEKSLLALCLHLMESASKVDPDNNVVLTPESTYSTQSRNQILTNLMTVLKNSQDNRTLGQSMVTEAKNLLKYLAVSGKVAGKGGDAEAQFLLGNCYGMGALGWSVNQEQAFSCFSQSAKQGHPEASYRAGVCCELGLGVAKDGVRAVMFFKKAAHLLHVPSMYKLGVIMMRGYCGHHVSRREAIIWLQRAAAQGETMKVNKDVVLPEALHALAIVQLSKECEDTSMIPDNNYAVELLKNAAKLGYAPSQYKLGQYYECGLHVPEDEARSIYWYQKAAAQNYAEAALAMSGWYLTGSINTKAIAQSDDQAFAWARMASFLARKAQLKMVNANANYSLGVYYKNGIGVDPSKEKSMKWFKRAASLGHTEAMKLISSDFNVTLANS